MRRAFCLIREQPHYRRDAFHAGLEAADCKLIDREPRYWRPGEVLVIWNRYGQYHQMALRCEAGGGIVLVAENGYLGRDWNGGNWYALSRSHHNGAGTWYPNGPERWDSWGVDLAYGRDPAPESLWAAALTSERTDIVLLPQRGIGPPGVAMPRDWVQRASKAVGAYARKTGRRVRVREHPGEKPCVPLEEDLKTAALVVTWGSGAALKAILMDIPCAHQFEQWIGAPASHYLTDDGTFEREDYARLETFRRLAWAMWTVEELASGLPFRRLLDS